MVPLDNAEAFSLGVAPGAPVVVLGNNRLFVTSADDMFVEALDADGSTLWHSAGTAKWGRAVSRTREHVFMGTEFSGKLDFQGVRGHASHSGALIAKLDNQGALAWGRVLTAGDFTRLITVAATPDGGVAVALGIFAAAKSGPLAVKVFGGQDAVIVKYDAAGEVAWTKTFDWPGYDEINNLFGTPDGGVIVSGTRWKSADSWSSSLADGRCHGFLTRLGQNGQPRWSTDLGSDTMRVTVTRSAAGAGGVVVSGSVRFRNRFGDIELDGGPKDQGYLAGIDDSGHVTWARLHAKPECLAIDKAGRTIQVNLEGVSVETTSGETTELMRFEKDALYRISDCQLDDSGHLYIAGEARTGAAIAGVVQPAPRIQRKQTSWLQAYSVGFIAKLSL